jgi:hypothetical protein
LWLINRILTAATDWTVNRYSYRPWQLRKFNSLVNSGRLEASKRSQSFLTLVYYAHCFVESVRSTVLFSKFYLLLTGLIKCPWCLGCKLQSKISNSYDKGRKPHWAYWARSYLWSLLRHSMLWLSVGAFIGRGKGVVQLGRTAEVRGARDWSRECREVSLQGVWKGHLGRIVWRDAVCVPLLKSSQRFGCGLELKQSLQLTHHHFQVGFATTLKTATNSSFSNPIMKSRMNLLAKFTPLEFWDFIILKVAFQSSLFLNVIRLLVGAIWRQLMVTLLMA